MRCQVYVKCKCEYECGCDIDGKRGKKSEVGRRQRLFDTRKLDRQRKTVIDKTKSCPDEKTEYTKKVKNPRKKYMSNFLLVGK